MTEPTIVTPESWYRSYWQSLGSKFLLGFFAGMTLLGAGFLVALYFVIRAATLSAMQEHVRQMTEAIGR